MNFSTKTKEAIKTALAMTIAYGIVLRMGWGEPMWAGFAVAFISLATVGQSLDKGVLRMLGTLVAGAVALFAIALFAQDRWLFMVFVSCWVGFCTYMMCGSRWQYFWNVCGFVFVIVAIEGGTDAQNAFQTAILRIQETGLGILVYSLVSILIWPVNSRVEFSKAISTLLAAQRLAYRACLEQMIDPANSADAQSACTKLQQAQEKFNQILPTATADTPEISELRQAWQGFNALTGELVEILERWRGSLAEVQSLDFQRLLPNLADYSSEFEQRIEQIERMLTGETPQPLPTGSELELNTAEEHSLSNFQKAALAVTCERLKQLQRLNLSQFNRLSRIKGFTQDSIETDAAPPVASTFVLDPERIAAAVQVMATLWLAYIIVIYVNGVPGGIGLVVMATPYSMAFASTPQLPVKVLLVPAAGSITFGGFLYIFVMPSFSTFEELGLLIFTATFAICYFLAAPSQALGKLIGLAMFLSMASVSSVQSYNFLNVPNTALEFLVVIAIMAIAAYVPFSPQPEKAIMRLLGRYFRSCHYMFHSKRFGQSKPSGRLERFAVSFHNHEIASLPGKIATWSAHVTGTDHSGAQPQQALVASLQVLSERMAALEEAWDTDQAPALAGQLQTEGRAWRLKFAQTFGDLTSDPGAAHVQTIRAGLDEVMARVETRIGQLLNNADESQFSELDSENFYRLLDAYRGTSQALLSYAGSADSIDWRRWQETRF